MKNLFGELSVQQAAQELNVGTSTLNRWLKLGLAPSTWNGRQRVVSQTVVDKIKIALSRHGSGNWPAHVQWTPFDSLENKTVPLDQLVKALDPVAENQTKDTSISPSVRELADIAKKLKAINEHELAAVVSLKAVELI